jgi:hypothetical protein
LSELLDCLESLVLGVLFGEVEGWKGVEGRGGRRSRACEYGIYNRIDGHGGRRGGAE